jgi:hypothetical protein
MARISASALKTPLSAASGPHHRQQGDGLPERDDIALAPRQVDLEPVLGRDAIDAGCRLDGACGIGPSVKIGKCSIGVYLSYSAYPSSNSREPISSSSPFEYSS